VAPTGSLLVEQVTKAQILVVKAPSLLAAGPRGVGKADTLDLARIARSVLGLRLDHTDATLTGVV